MRVYLVRIFNDTYDTLNEILVFSSEQKARNYLRQIKERASELGWLDEYKDLRGLAYVTFVNEDNLMYTYSLDLVPTTIDQFDPGNKW